MIRDGETVSQGILVPFFYVRIVVPELLLDSTTVVQAAVNRQVVGSNPTQAVKERWQSGLMHLITNQKKRKNFRGFESYSFRSEADV